MHKQHDFDDCKCCQQPSYCLTCGFTRLELEQTEEIRRIKAQMKARHKDYAKTISDLAGQLSALWLQLGCDGAMMGEQKNKEIEKEKR